MSRCGWFKGVQAGTDMFSKNCIVWKWFQRAQANNFSRGLWKSCYTLFIITKWSVHFTNEISELPGQWQLISIVAHIVLTI